MKTPVFVRQSDGVDAGLVTAAGELNVIATAQPGVDLGDVTLTAGVNNIGDVDVLIGGAVATANAGANGASVQRMTLATDDELNDDADATRIALEIIDDWDETNRAAVNPIAGQIGIAGGTGVDGATVPRVTLATNVGLPAGANNIGDVDVLTLPALPAGANNIGDVDVVTLPGALTGLAEDAAHITGDVGVEALAVHTDLASTLTGANGEYAPLVATRLGAVRTAIQPEAYIDSLGAYYLVVTAFTTVTTVGAAEIQPVAAQGVNNSIVLIDWIVSTDTAINAQFESDDSDAGITVQVFLSANGGWTSDHAAAWGETADNQALKLDVSAAATVSVQVRYFVR
mgnify:CR=1 FL=1